MSKAAETLQRRFGANLGESLGVRSAAPALADRFHGETGPPSASPDDGRTRAREAGHMELERIVPDPDQPRKEFEAEAIDRLAASIRKHGQLQPLRVRWNPELGKWVVIVGERRYRAAQQAGVKTVSCIFIDGELTPAEILQEQLLENVMREDLKPVEAARAYRQLMDANRWNAEELSQELHISPATISRTLALLKLPADIQARVDAGDIPASAAYEVAKVAEPEARKAIVAKVASGELTRDQAAAAVRRRPQSAGKGKGRAGARPRKVTSRTLRASTGYKVTVEFRRGVEPAIAAATLRELAERLDAEAAGASAAA
jgi:ParB family chromosome partitioning protein